ncbi:glutamyl-tRNA(Gln) amidotransferase subunit A [Mycobacterium xenopi 4042]|uniref:Glutamyl-tRNA(Gln) amidotransferase subunit A n=1 Tax=Mycobacterium xenopi 4042 TaxID=1299334 RepID=X7Z3R7_MYCXE|nr:glutamyl-tRNA(Gln) amidotransferase subunit A [Mycobacterium xenopi 4042]
MTDIVRLNAATLAAKLAAKELSSTELTQACLDQIQATDERYNAFLHVAADQALAAAGAVDRSLAAGEPLPSPLAGVPLALKDVFTTVDMPTTCGSKILEGWRSPYDATVTVRLRAAGIPILGKTNMDEFAMGSSTENSAYGPTRNPWNVERVPGGSGGGSAAALAAFQAPLAIGTDTGGSIRQPAALTATVGVKPTYGTVSRYGLVACASSLDQGGPCARTVLDTALLHQVIAGHDPRDSTSIGAPVPDVVGRPRSARTEICAGAHRGGPPAAQRRGLPARRAGVVQRRRRTVDRTRRRGERSRLPALRLRAGGLLPDLAVGGVEQPGAVRRDALWAASRRRRHAQRRRGDGVDSRRRVRPRSQAAHHDWHLCAVGRLLRRLLQPGAKGPHLDRPRPR